jgi:hypothetical protein
MADYTITAAVSSLATQLLSLSKRSPYLEVNRGNSAVATVGTVLPLAEASAAHEVLEGKFPRKCGKIVLQVAA